MRSIDLAERRGAGGLLATTVALFLRHSGLFLSVTFVVVAPVLVLVDGVWGRALADGPGAHRSVAAAVASSLLSFAMPPLVTALHAVIVREMGVGRVLSVGEALRAAAPRFPVVVAVVLLYTIGAVVGFCLLVVPGIWLGVACYFGAQAAVLERETPLRALERSAALVKGHWWRTLRALLASWLVFGGASAAAGFGIQLVHAGVPYVVLHTVVESLSLSLSALFGTLLFFTLRARETDGVKHMPTYTVAG